MKADPNASEGLLAPRFNALVRKEACADVAREIDLGAVLKLGRSEMQSGGRRKAGAAGRCDGSGDCRGLLKTAGLMRHARDPAPVGQADDYVEEDARDAKTALQEWAQARGRDAAAIR